MKRWNTRALDAAIADIEASVMRNFIAMRADAEARKASGEPPETVWLRYDAAAGPNLAVGEPRFAEAGR